MSEPAAWVDRDFDPIAALADYPVLVIPSGGLNGLADSPSFRARLQEYTRRGGVVIIFGMPGLVAPARPNEGGGGHCIPAHRPTPRAHIKRCGLFIVFFQRLSEPPGGKTRCELENN